MNRLTFDPRTSQYACAVIVGEELVGEPWSVAYFDVDLAEGGGAWIEITEVAGPDGSNLDRSKLDMDHIEQQCRDALADAYDILHVSRKAQ